MPRIGNQKNPPRQPWNDGDGTADNPWLVDENGHIVFSLSPPRPRRPTRRPSLSPLRPTRRQPTAPEYVPPRPPTPAGEPLPGTRAPRTRPLTDEDLYIDDVRPPVKITERSHYECGICLHIKSHPVYYACGHGHCYVCIRKWLEHSWLCPICQATMYEKPFRNYDLDKGIAYDLLDWNDRSLVTLSWEGLTFPAKPANGPAMAA
ncbi:hypothetical protein C8R47DRAFT_1220847 [Mycena vitilis]|nr:hypothetical protein C8R47DRAFT_1220847 [Mycena vitilis]